MRVPKRSRNGRIRKDFDLSFGKPCVVRDGNYPGERCSSIDNSIYTRAPGFFVHRAPVAFNLRDKGLELSLFVDDISGKGRITCSFDTAPFGFLVQSHAQPRWLGGWLRQSV